MAILDWELCAIGHPLSDLANMLLPWYIPSPNMKMDANENSSRSFFGIANVSVEMRRKHGIPDVDTLIRAYCERRGLTYPIKNWTFFVVYAMYRVEWFPFYLISGIILSHSLCQITSDQCHSSRRECTFQTATIIFQQCRPDWKVVSFPF